MYRRRFVSSLAGSSTCFPSTTTVSVKRDWGRSELQSSVTALQQRSFSMNDCECTNTDLLPRPRRNEKMKVIFDQFLSSVVRTQEEVKNLRIQNPRGVFVNYTMNMKDVNVFGFDYDYTMANYSLNLERLIYDMALKELLERGYPEGMRMLQYDPKFAIRGLHYDMDRGNLLKLDFLGHVQVCLFGRKPVPTEKISSIYENRTILENCNLRIMHDIFCSPEVCLLSDTIQFFVDHDIRFNPTSVYEDVSSTVGHLHRSGVLHKEIMKNLDRNLSKSVEKKELLNKLVAGGKKLFLLTNSDFCFVDAGMRFMFDDDNWRDLFDVIITSAKKPSFYSARRPFREVDTKTGILLWSDVSSLKKGRVYCQGGLEDFKRMTGWNNSSILYFGDHLASDIVEANRKVGWRTGCIIKELEREVNIQNSSRYREILGRVLDLDKLISDCQRLWSDDSSEDDEIDTIEVWRKQRDYLMDQRKCMFNPMFGSAFRSQNDATYFAYTMRRYADLYTSRLENLLPFPLHKDYIFFPHRSYLPHEPSLGRHL